MFLSALTPRASNWTFGFLCPMRRFRALAASLGDTCFDRIWSQISRFSARSSDPAGRFSEVARSIRSAQVHQLQWQVISWTIVLEGHEYIHAHSLGTQGSRVAKNMKSRHYASSECMSVPYQQARQWVMYSRARTWGIAMRNGDGMFWNSVRLKRLKGKKRKSNERCTKENTKLEKRGLDCFSFILLYLWVCLAPTWSTSPCPRQNQSHPTQ